MATLKNPDAPTLANPIDLDRAIQQLQELLLGATWLQKSFGRAKLIKYKEVVQPMVYQGKKEYYPVLPNDELKSYSFFKVSGSKGFDEYAPNNSMFQATPVDLIVWANLKKIDKTKDYDFTEELISDVVNLLNRDPNVEQVDVFDEQHEDVFEGYDVEDKRDLLIYPYTAFRVSMVLRYPVFKEGCELPPIPWGKPISRYTDQELKDQLTAAQLDAVCGYSDSAEEVFSTLNIVDKQLKDDLSLFIDTCGWDGITEIIIPAIHNTKGLKGIVTPTLNGVAGGLKGYQFNGTQYVNSNYNPVAQGDTEDNFSIGVLTNYAKSKAAGSDLYSMLTGVYNFGGNPSAGVGFYEDNTAFSSVGGGAPPNVAQAEFDRLGFYTKTDEYNVYFYLNDQLVDTVPLSGNGLPNTTLPIGAGKFDNFGVYSIVSHFTGNIAVWFVGNSNFDPEIFHPAADKLIQALSVAQKDEAILYGEVVVDQINYIINEEIVKVYNYNHITGQTTEYAIGDDVWVKNNYFNDVPTSGKLVTLVDFFTLAENNDFGNTSRFTDDQGGQVYANDYIIDHWTGLGWYKVLQSPVTWSTAILEAYNSTLLSYTDWFIPNRNQISSLINHAVTQLLNYSPFNIAGNGGRIYHSTTYNNNASQTTAVYNGLSGFYGLISINGKTDPYNYLLCRKHF